MNPDPNLFEFATGKWLVDPSEAEAAKDAVYMGSVAPTIKKAADVAQGYMTRGEMGVDRKASTIKDKYTSQFDQMGQDAQNRVGLTMGGIDPSAQNEWRTQQQNMAQGLMNSRYGHAESAQRAQDMGLSQAMAQQKSMMAGATGPNRALSQRMGMQNLSDQQNQVIQQGRISAAQEAMQKQQLGANIMQQGRGQDLQMQGLNLQGQQGNLNAQMQQRQMNDQMTQMYMSQGFSRDEAQMKARMSAEQLMAQNYQTVMGGMLGGQDPKNQDATGGGILGGIGGALGGIFGSDERIKKDIKDKPREETYSFLDALEDASWIYKDPEAYGQGKHYGVMAQSAAKSKLGKSMLTSTPDGYMAFDIRKALGAALASVKGLHERLKTVEGPELAGAKA